MSNSNSILLGTFLNKTLDLYNENKFNAYLSYSLVIENCLSYSQVVKELIIQYKSQKRRVYHQDINETDINNHIVSLPYSVNKLNKGLKIKSNEDNYNYSNTIKNKETLSSKLSVKKIDNPELNGKLKEEMTTKSKPKVHDGGIEKLFPDIY